MDKIKLEAISPTEESSSDGARASAKRKSSRPIYPGKLSANLLVWAPVRFLPKDALVELEKCDISEWEFYAVAPEHYPLNLNVNVAHSLHGVKVCENCTRTTPLPLGLSLTQKPPLCPGLMVGP